LCPSLVRLKASRPDIQGGPLGTTTVFGLDFLTLKSLESNGSKIFLEKLDFQPPQEDLAPADQLSPHVVCSFPSKRSGAKGYPAQGCSLALWVVMNFSFSFRPCCPRNLIRTNESIRSCVELLVKR